MRRSFAHSLARAVGPFAAVALVALASCRPERPAGPPDESRRVGDDAALTLRAELSRTALRAGERATLTLTLRNASDSTVTVVLGEGCPLLPYIEDEQGTLVYPRGGWGCTAVVTRLVLPPGGTRRLELEIHAGAPQAAIHTGAILPPGRYRAYGTLGLTPDRLRSNVVDFTIRA